MVRGRIRPKTKNRYKRRMRDAVKGLSRKVAIYKQPAKSECPNCYYEKLTDKSTGVCKWTIAEALSRQADWISGGGIGTRYKYFLKGRCPVCRGIGFLESVRRTWADCLVTWDPQARGFGNNMTYTPAGTEGSTVVQLKTDPKFFDTFRNCKKIVVDGIECKLSKPPVLRGLGNQTLLIVTAFTTDKPSIDSGEIIKDYS
jgi:hypothetical protein